MVGSSWSPAVVVGIDFGMTSTGVAYSSQDSNWATIETIQQWPDRDHSLFSKYPSRVGYDKSGKAVDWGTCTLSHEVDVTERQFKLHLDPSFGNGPEDALLHQKAVKHYVNYMRQLNKHVDAVLAQRVPRWRDRYVEYRFSIPTTWKNPRLTNHLKIWLAEAGFVNAINRKIIFSQTEAEAAAVYATKGNLLQQGDVAMVVDAGGATTDINLLQVTRSDADLTQMSALSKAEGINIGSTMIDNAAKRLIEQKLASLHVYNARGLTSLAQNLMDISGFEYYKCNFGEDADLLDHYIAVPGRAGQWLTLKHAELEPIFYALVESLIEAIKDQITSLALVSPRQDLRYIILSGGLGSSNYVKQKVMLEFGNTHSNILNGTATDVIIATDPQLAVVKGLVMDRSMTIGQDARVWIRKCSRVSFGIICQYAYDSAIHFGEPTVLDPVTGTLLVEDQIDWMIKEGDNIPEEGITKEYSLRVTPDQQLEPFYAHIVMSELPAKILPSSKHRGPVTKVCTVEGYFSPSDFIEGSFVKKKRRLFSKQQLHDVAKFKLKINVSSTDLAFECVSLDGRSYSENSPKVRVNWDSV